MTRFGFTPAGPNAHGRARRIGPATVTDAAQAPPDGGQLASLADLVWAVAPEVPSELVASECLDAIGSVAALLPGAVTTHFGFESRLGAADARADFTLMASVAGSGRAILAGAHPVIPRPRVLLDDPRWGRARDFTTDWADSASPLYEGADFVCLEFDVADGEPRASVPNVFFAQVQGNWIGDDARASDARMTRARSTLERGVELLAGESLAPATAAALRDCFAALPAHSWAFQVGVMGARDPAPVRLQFNSMSRQEFLAFLRRVGWGGALGTLDALVTDLGAFTDDITYAIDLLEHGLGPTIGLECYIRDDDLARPGGRWSAILDHLVAQGWCRAAKRDALLAYPGVSLVTDGEAALSPNLARAAGLFGRHATHALVRYLHHIKVVLRNEAIEAKGYLGVAQRWVARTG